MTISLEKRANIYFDQVDYFNVVNIIYYLFFAMRGSPEKTKHTNKEKKGHFFCLLFLLNYKMSFTFERYI